MSFARSTLAIITAAWFATPLTAQIPLTAPAEARRAPGGTVVATLERGTRVTPGQTQGPDVFVVFDGWVDAGRISPKRDTQPAFVNGRPNLRLRATPSLRGAILGEFLAGAGVTILGQTGNWMNVRRSAWVPLSALTATTPRPERAAPVAAARAAPAKSAPEKSAPAKLAPAKAARAMAAASAPPSAAVSAAAPPGGMAVPASEPADAVPADALSATRGAKLLAAPGGSRLAELAAGTIVQPLARERGWVRVRVEGWVTERELAPADSSFGAALTAADLRADPEGTRGKVVRWEVQLLSLQTADPLRRELARDEPYLLARGPGGESALLYLAVPPSLLSDARAIPPLAHVLITARVRSGRSEPVGTPILDLKSISRR